MRSKKSACDKGPCRAASKVISVPRAGSEKVASLTEVGDGFFDVREVHICCQVALTRLMEDVYNPMVFECLSWQRISVTSKVGQDPRLLGMSRHTPCLLRSQ